MYMLVIVLANERRGKGRGICMRGGGGGGGGKDARIAHYTSTLCILPFHTQSVIAGADTIRHTRHNYLRHILQIVKVTYSTHNNDTRL